jgi:hypothetical protein
MQLFEYYNENDNQSARIDGTHYSYQPFRPGVVGKKVDQYIHKIKLKLWKNNAATWKFYIRIDNIIDGFQVISLPVTTEGITTSSPGEWYEFTFDPPIKIKHNKAYSIQLRSYDSKRVYWRYTSPDKYNDYTFTDCRWSGMFWRCTLKHPPRDAGMFELWGYKIPEKQYKAIPRKECETILSNQQDNYESIIKNKKLKSKKEEKDESISKSGNLHSSEKV